MTSTDICNLALAELGAGRIASLTDGTEAAVTCSMQYDRQRSIVIRQFPWGFAKRIDKAQLLNNTISGYLYAYYYPRNCLRILHVVPIGEKYKRREPIDYEIYNVTNDIKAIVCDEKLINIEYIEDVTDCNLFDSLFIDAFVHKLASALAMPVAGNSGMADRQYQMYQASLAEAKSLAAKESKHKLKYISEYAKARQGV